MSDPRPSRVLLVGGGGGLVGRALLPEILDDHRVRSVHRHPTTEEAGKPVEWVALDVAAVTDWRSTLEGVDVVVNLVWYRWASRRAFARLYDGLHRLLDASREASIARFLHVSVPDAPTRLESRIPYLRYKRQFDHAVAESGLSYRIVRPSLLFGPHDRLLTVMLGLMDRYRRFPMFGDGNYHVNPLWVGDLAHVLHQELHGTATGTVVMGGPEVRRYRDLTDFMFRALGLPPRYVSLGPRSSVGIASLFQHLGSSLIYAYEVEWLLSDRLTIPPFTDSDRPLARVEPFLTEQAHLLREPPGLGRQV
ncbi:MAG: NAD(P)H-binding protein [Thermoplasmata archaeon]